MRYLKIFLSMAFIAMITSCNKESDMGPVAGDGLIIDHSCTKLASIPSEWIVAAKDNLHIAYSHTSHGSQLTEGMSGLVSFKGTSYSWNNGGADGALDLHDYAMNGDLGNPDRTSWASATRTYLATNTDVNVIIWAWCGEVSNASEADINTYLDLMNGLERDFPSVRFVYMTGHLDGTGLTGNLHLRNEQIRNYCTENKKILYDFADIECYNPDGTYFGGKKPDDACDYDTNGDGTRDGNWATEWQNTHDQGMTGSPVRPLIHSLKCQPESICCLVALGKTGRMEW